MEIIYPSLQMMGDLMVHIQNRELVDHDFMNVKLFPNLNP